RPAAAPRIPGSRLALPGAVRRPGRQSAVAPPPASLPPLPARVRERVLAQAGASRCAPAVAWVTVTVEPGAVQALLAAERTAAPARVHSSPARPATAQAPPQ